MSDNIVQGTKDRQNLMCNILVKLLGSLTLISHLVYKCTEKQRGKPSFITLSKKIHPIILT